MIDRGNADLSTIDDAEAGEHVTASEAEGLRAYYRELHPDPPPEPGA